MACWPRPVVSHQPFGFHDLFTRRYGYCWRGLVEVLVPTRLCYPAPAHVPSSEAHPVCFPSLWRAILMVTVGVLGPQVMTSPMPCDCSWVSLWFFQPRAFAQQVCDARVYPTNNSDMYRELRAAKRLNCQNNQSLG